MNILFSKFKEVNVRFPNHVKQRVLQRFKLYMTKTEQQNVELFLRKDFAKAQLNMSRFCMSPFYINAADSVHGKNSFIASTQYLNYYGNYSEKENCLIIKTVIKKTNDVKNFK